MNTASSLHYLGSSGLHVTPIGLGCWQFSKMNNYAGKFWPKLEDDQITSIVGQALQNGINWFDTAEIYGGGASEKALSAALQRLGKKPGEVVIATKWWPLFRTASNIGKTIDDRLAALDPFPIDLYQVHQPYGLSNEKAEMKAMAALVKAGKIRYVGVSNFSAGKMRNAWETLNRLGIPLISNQVRYNLLDRSIESNGILQTAKELGITIIAYSPLAQGILSGKFHDNPDLLKNIGFRKYTSIFKPSGLEKSRPLIEKLKSLGIKYNVTASQVALNWLLNIHGDSVVAIPGSTQPIQAKEDTDVMKFKLSEEDLLALSAIR
jgi:aryl-alcohol dehydrogenase-like predicted oxidoreductase